ncbi:MAG: hypothetical protein ABI592_16610 [Acidobacteriota bacterium]
MTIERQPTEEIAGFADRVSAYLPTLFAGLLVLAAGAVVGWIVKRVVVRILIWLRLDRLGGRLGWRAALGRGDTRAALYNLAGNTAMMVVLLLFLDNALVIWGLTVLSRMIERIVISLPNIGLAVLVVVLGVLVARMASQRVEDALEQEEIPYARLAGGICRALLLTVTGALALWQLGFARQIVLAGFLVFFGAIGVAFALAAGLGSARAMSAGWEALFRKRKREE